MVWSRYGPLAKGRAPVLSTLTSEGLWNYASMMGKFGSMCSARMDEFGVREREGFMRLLNQHLLVRAGKRGAAKKNL